MSKVINFSIKNKCTHKRTCIANNDFYCVDCKEMVNPGYILKNIFNDLPTTLIDAGVIKQALTRYYMPESINFLQDDLQRISLDIENKKKELERITSLINELREENNINIRLVTDGSCLDFNDSINDELEIR